jgi:hypothetical protein
MKSVWKKDINILVSELVGRAMSLVFLVVLLVLNTYRFKYS